MLQLGDCFGKGFSLRDDAFRSGREFAAWLASAAGGIRVT
jgi:hypothetical protein